MTCGREFDWETTICPDDNTPLTALGEEDQLVGTTLADRYEIMEVIGGGGMGLVYKARHKLMNRIVAIKMLHKHMISSKDTLKRFQLEAQAASCLSLPNILTVYDFGLTNEGQPYMVMDYLEGTSLSDVLEKEHHLDPDRAVNIFIQACAGLAHAHQKGVLHRDIKPSNIMLVNFGDQADFVKIVDFGIAKLLNQGEPGELTKTGEVYGSPSYMSPEQCRGKETDARSDIYSMGCVMYRSLTGRPLFAGDDIIELLFKQVSETPEPFDPDLHIPHDLEVAVFKALAKDPNDRYATMNDFKDALEKYVEKRAGKTTATPTPTVEGPMPLWKRQGEGGAASPAAKSKSSVSNPVPEIPAAATASSSADKGNAANQGAAASASASAPPAAASSSSSDQPVRAMPDNSRARGNESAQPPKSRTAESPIPSAPVNTPPAAAREHAPSPRTSQPLPTSDTKHGAQTHLRQRMAGDNKMLIITIAAVSAVVVLIGGGMFAFNAMHPSTSVTADSGKSGGSVEEVTAHLPDANAQAAYDSGRESFRTKKYEDARIEFEEALALTEKGSGMNSKELVPILRELSLVYRKLDKLSLAEGSLKRAIPLQEHAGGKKDATLASLNFALAQTYHEDGRPKDADASGKKALVIAKSVLGPTSSKVGEIETFLSTNLPGQSGSIGSDETKTAVTPPVEHKEKPVEIKPPVEKPPVAAEKPTTVTPSETPAKEDTSSDSKPTKVASTQTSSTTHAAAHPHHNRHPATTHRGGGETPAPVRHRRAYSSYGF